MPIESRFRASSEEKSSLTCCCSLQLEVLVPECGIEEGAAYPKQHQIAVVFLGGTQYLFHIIFRLFTNVRIESLFASADGMMPEKFSFVSVFVLDISGLLLVDQVQQGDGRLVRLLNWAILLINAPRAFPVVTFEK